MDQPGDRPVRVIYTGAACQANPGGPGGWGFVILQDGQQPTEGRGGMVLPPASSPKKVTSNRMELMAVCIALESLDRPALITLYSASRYVIDGGNSHLGKWKRNGWMTAKSPHRRPGQAANKDLWQRVDKALGPHEVHWKYLPRHAGDLRNEQARELARAGMKEAASNS
jgi:ribonuclease HI